MANKMGDPFYTDGGFEKSQQLDEKTFGALFNPQLPENFQAVNRKENTIGCSEEWIFASCATMLCNLSWYYPETFDQ